jgi:hypothetical protein
MENVMCEPEVFPGMIIRVGRKAVLVNIGLRVIELKGPCRRRAALEARVSQHHQIGTYMLYNLMSG